MLDLSQTKRHPSLLRADAYNFRLHRFPRGQDVLGALPFRPGKLGIRHDAFDPASELDEGPERHDPGYGAGYDLTHAEARLDIAPGVRQDLLEAQ